MKTAFSLASLALVAFTACTDMATTPNTVASTLTPRYGTKPSPAPPPTNPLVCPSGVACQKFEGVSLADDEVGIASGSLPTTVAPTPADTVTFAGRFANYTVGFAPGNSGPIILTLNLYIIGTWSGDAKKGPSQQWQLAYTCAGGAPTLIVNATFSNRLGNAQSYPYNLETAKHGGGMNGATGLNILNYKSRPDLQDTFSQYSTDVGDARYAIQRTIPACPAGQTRQIQFKGLNLANIFNASWGIDNISVQPVL